MEEFFAHTSESKKWQPLKEHLENVARLCEENCCKNDKRLGYAIGLLHDLGKYQKKFQDKLRDNKIKVDHSTFGAKTVFEQAADAALNQIASYAIASHHTGLVDGGRGVDIDSGTLAARLKKDFDLQNLYGDFSRELNDISGLLPNESSEKNFSLEDYYKDKHGFAMRYSTKIRMLLSALVDADWLDTETYVQGEQKRGYNVDFKTLSEKLENHIASFGSDTPINAARKDFSGQVLSHINSENSLFKLDLPTGSGKTLTSMRFALKRLLAKKKKRIIYVVPYTSIIEQNAGVFKDIFGDGVVIEHHSNFETEKLTEDEASKYRFATENWDASIIITTNLQFFESFYSDKPSQIRKLHNMAESVVCFDELQSIPIKCLQPCYDAIKILARDYGSDMVFMTATMPNPDKFVRLLGGAEDLVEDKSKYPLFERCGITYIGGLTLDGFCQIIDKSKSNLIVTNTKDQAFIIYKNIDCPKKYYLSTRLIPRDRKRIIENIRADLRQSKPITVVSTSLVEAGVDLDFEFVYRWINGVDSILQCAGRCNREGKRSYGKTMVFWLTDVKDARDGETAAKIQLAKNIINKYENINAFRPINEYFEQLFENQKDTVSTLNFENYFEKTKLAAGGRLVNFYSVKFAEYADDFRYIERNTYDLVVLNDESSQILKEMEYKPTVENKRKLQKDTLSVYDYELKKLLSAGCVAKALDEIYCLADSRYYDENLGLVFEPDGGQDNVIIDKGGKNVRD